MESADFKSSVDRLRGQSENTQTGGSAYAAGESLPRRVIQGPFLVFRPFPWEVHSAMSGFAALEGLGLLIFAWCKRKDFWALVHRWRDPSCSLHFGVLFEFAVIFAAATSNFGILVRQRIMMVPVFLMLFCVPRELRRAVTSRPATPRNHPVRGPWPATRSGRSTP